jgi:hypothetical protein
VIRRSWFERLPSEVEKTMKQQHEDRAADELRLRLDKLEARDRRPQRVAALGLVAVVVGAPLIAAALDTVPHVFSRGDKIVADELNANFEYLQNAISDVEGAVPSGAVMFFDLASCPSGWSELSDARGRVLVGLNGSAGTLKGSVGEPLGDLESRTHAHDIDIAETVSSSTSVAHTHALPAGTTGVEAGHQHQWWANGSSFNGAGSSITVPQGAFQTGGAFNYEVLVGSPSYVYYTSNSPAHSHSIAAGESATSGSTAHTHDFDPAPATTTSASTADILPYLQLLVCRRD